MSEVARHSTSLLTTTAVVALTLVALVLLPLGIVALEELATGSHYFERLMRATGLHHALGELYKAVGLID